MKTASTLSWVFPGMGHYYSGRTGKGIMFTGMELFSVAALLGASNNYDLAEEEYQLAKQNWDGVQTATVNCDDQGIGLSACSSYWKSEMESNLDSKNTAQITRIAAGTAAVGIWLWNTRDVKKRSAYSDNSRFSFGVNSYGQVEARIKF